MNTDDDARDLANLGYTQQLFRVSRRALQPQARKRFAICITTSEIAGQLTLGDHVQPRPRLLISVAAKPTTAGIGLGEGLCRQVKGRLRVDAAELI